MRFRIDTLSMPDCDSFCDDLIRIEHHARGIRRRSLYQLRPLLEEYISSFIFDTMTEVNLQNNIGPLLRWGVAMASTDLLSSLIGRLAPLKVDVVLNAFVIMQETRPLREYSKVVAVLMGALDLSFGIGDVALASLLRLNSPALRIMIAYHFPIKAVCNLGELLTSTGKKGVDVLPVILPHHPDWDELRSDTGIVHTVAWRGELGKLKILLDMGAEIDPLRCLIRCKHISIVKYLIEKFDLNPNARMDNECLLSCAVANGNIPFIRELLKIGVEVSGINGHLALKASMGKRDITKLLIACGADINSVHDDRRESILHTCCRKPTVHIDYIKFLIKHGANVNALDSLGNTPLVYGILARRHDVIGSLISQGALSDQVNVEGDTPLSIAQSLGIDEQIDLYGCSFVPKRSKRARNSFIEFS